MEQVNSTKIRSGFGSNRKSVKARFWDGSGLSSWKNTEVSELTDEGKNIISIGRVAPSPLKQEVKTDAKLFFLLEDIPSLIATLTKVAEDSQKTEFQNQIDWQVNELKKGL
tara:strand:- start:101 stop:433 length:333 start_codon:yes stop_codon:yes gene_type:complete